jgi:uncharacterized protein (TIGR00297 family)
MILSPIEILAGILVIILLASFAIKLGAVDIPGAGAGSVVAFVSFEAGGFIWLVYIVIFFAISSMMTKYRYEHKQRLESAQEKGGRRSWPNTIANGIVPAVAAVGQIIFPSVFLKIVFLSSVATSMSDTLATEVGLLSQSNPRLITKPRTVVLPGFSGGITSLGLLVSVVAALGMGIEGTVLLFPAFELPSAIAAISIGAIGGTLFDSFLGATLQSLNKCDVCGKLVEGSLHHGVKTTHLKGLKFMNNNSVNFLGTSMGALIAVLVYTILT